MKCDKCGLIFRGHVKKCPRCGTFVVKEKFFEREINLFQKIPISISNVINLVLLNIVFFEMITEIILNSYYRFNLHIYPWLFLGLFLSKFLLFNIILNIKYSRMLSIKYYLTILIFTFLFGISYFDPNSLAPFNNFQIIFGLILPISFLSLSIGGIIYFISNKKFDVLSFIINGVVLLSLSSLSFGLSFIPYFKIDDFLFLRLTSLFSYIFNIFVLINGAILTGALVKHNL